MSSLHNVTDATFDTEVLQSHTPVLVDYWATWCRPCQMIAPILEELAGQYEGKIKIFKMNVDENTKTPAKYSVRGIPTLMVFKNGKVVSTKAGFLSKPQLIEFLDSQLDNKTSHV
jgi:thioredoxin 1